MRQRRLSAITSRRRAKQPWADDLDGTVRHELIHHEAGATSPEVLSAQQIRRLITEAGREPVERDTLYRRVIRSL